MDAIDLIHESLRVRFEPDPGGGYHFTTAVLVDGAWRPAAAWPNTVVAGGLALAPDSIEPGEAGWRLRGIAHGAGVDPTTVSFAWEGTIARAPRGGMTFEARMTLPAPLAEPPALVLWLGPLSTMTDRQALTWRRTLLAGPTRNAQGLPGNDLPALYFFDPATAVETILAYDSQMLTWAPGRFLTLQCREVLEYGNPGRYGVGLVGARGPLPAGEYRFRWHLWQRPAHPTPAPWEATRTLVDTIAPLLDGNAERPEGATSWEDFAAGTLRDLQQPEETWVEVPGPDGIHLGLRAYVRHAAHLYEHAPDHFELMTVADVLAPLLLYLKLHPEPGGERLAARLLASLPGFHSPDLHYIGNRYPPAPRDTLCDLWYCFENGLIKYAWIALASGNSALAAIVLDGMRGASVLAERTNFCFPLFADFGAAGGPTPTGSASNYSVAGLYAFGALLAAELSGDPRERDAARHALAALRPLPAELMYHEPQQLAFGAAAAAILARDGDQEMATLADRLAHAQVRMVYWHEDPYALAQGYRVRGLFQACASLLDPAFKEEVEAILPWVVLLRDGLGPTELLLKLLNLGRQHSFAFFEPCLPGRAGHSACPFIPYENLGTTELPETGTIGKEIYGAGEVFWLYLLFEALARTNDPTICTIFLDLLEPATLASFPPLQRRFMLYNPTAEARDFEVQFSHLAPGGYTLVTRPEGIFLPAEPTALASGVPLRLEAHRWQEIELIPEGS